MRKEIEGLAEKQIRLSLILRSQVLNMTVREEVQLMVREIQNLYEAQIASLEADLFEAQMGETFVLKLGNEFKTFPLNEEDRNDS